METVHVGALRNWSRIAQRCRDFLLPAIPEVPDSIVVGGLGSAVAIGVVWVAQSGQPEE
jgi:hypothetical protein